MIYKLRIIALVLCGLLLGSAQANAHLRLERSTPAQGDTVREPLTEISLVFSQAVEPRYTTFVLLDGNGLALDLGTLEPIGEGKTPRFRYRLVRPINTGDFVVQWKTVGEDGHVITGSFDFTVDVANSLTVTGAPQNPTPQVAPEHAHHVPETAVAPLFQTDSVPWVLARWLNFIGLVLMVGAVAFRLMVVQRVRSFSDDVITTADRGARNIALAAALIALAGNALRLWLQSGSLHGADRIWEWALLRPMILDMGWGKAWLAQSAATLAFIVATRMRTQNPLESWIAAALFAMIAASTPAFAGHAAAVEQMAIVPIVNDAIHVIAAAAWLGTLTVLLFAGIPAIARASQQPFQDAAMLIRVFSPLALFAAAVAVATGTMSAFVHIQAIPELWTTPYGKTLSIKLLIVLLTATTGAYNWKVVSPRLGTQDATLHIKRSAFAEVIIASAIIAVTAVLVALPLH